MIIRKAEEKDSHWIASQLRDFSKFYISKTSLYSSTEHALKVINNIIDNHILFVAENKDGKKTGLIAGLVFDHFLNPDIKTLNELWWWVPEEHRGSRSAALLLKEFVQWGRDNVDWIVCTLESNSPVNPDVLEKRGFRKQETNFLMEIDK